MKKIVLLIILMISCILVGCGGSEESITIKIDNFTINSTTEKVDFEVTLFNTETLGKNDKIKEYNILYVFENVKKEELLKKPLKVEEKKELNLTEKNILSINFTEANYTNDLTLIMELELSNEEKIYSLVKNVNIFELAKATYEKDNTNLIAKKICDMDKVSKISLEIDLNKKSEEGSGDNYSYTYSNPNYDKITIIITLKGDFEFSDDFELSLNEKVIDNSKYTIENNVLTYIFKDPNWSGIY